MIMREYDKGFGVSGPEWKIPKPAAETEKQPLTQKKDVLFNSDLQTVIRMKKEGREIADADIKALEQRVDGQFNKISTLYRYLKKQKGGQAEGWKEMAEKNPTFAAEYKNWQEQKLKLSFLEGRLTKKEQEDIALLYKGEAATENIGKNKQQEDIDKGLAYEAVREEIKKIGTQKTDLAGSKEQTEKTVWDDIEETSARLNELRSQLKTHSGKKPGFLGLFTGALAKWEKQQNELTTEIQRLEKRAQALQSVGAGDIEKRKKQEKGIVIPFRKKAQPDRRYSGAKHYGKAAAVAAGVLVGLSPAGKNGAPSSAPPEEPTAHTEKIIAGQSAPEVDAETFLNTEISGPLDEAAGKSPIVPEKKARHKHAAKKMTSAERKTIKEFSSPQPFPVATYPETERKLFDRGPIQVERPGLVAREDTDTKAKARWWKQILKGK